MKTSSLNPLASSFVPSKVQAPSEMVSLGKISSKSFLASKYLQDLLENKKKKNESAITREEISGLIMRLMDCGDRKSHKYDPVILKDYLKSKVPDTLSIKPLAVPKLEEKKLKSSDVKIKGFDLSAFKAPKGSILLVSLYGLYRQEQALRPMISMTHRPESLEDRVWSVTPNDLRVWNVHAVEKPCHCPPMFGYSVPPGVFGNPLKIEFLCEIDTPHLNRYATSSDGDELALVPSERRPAVLCSGGVFKEPEDSGSVKGSLDFYLQEFKMLVSSVCKIISEEKKEIDCKGFLPEFETCDLGKELWDSDVTANAPKADEVMEDDDCHPLLDHFPTLDEETESKGVATDIKELLRSCSSETTDSGMSEDCCDPPCSHWCQSSPKCTNRTREALDILNDTTDFLLNFGSRGSNSSDSAPTLRPNFKRSFSANDCEAYLKSAPPASTKDALPFLRKDPLNFLRKLKDPCDSWKDSDSGILSNCSQDEFRDYGFEEGEEYLADVDMAPMWSFFSGDGSLWQPLPSPNQEECIKFPHKRVKELRRLQSMT